MGEVDTVLGDAGWVGKEWKGPGDIVGSRMNRPIVGYTFVSGIYVQIDNRHAADFTPIAEALANLLTEDGIAAKAEIGRIPENTNNDVIQILIGKKAD